MADTLKQWHIQNGSYSCVYVSQLCAKFSWFFCVIEWETFLVSHLHYVQREEFITHRVACEVEWISLY